MQGFRTTAAAMSVFLKNATDTMHRLAKMKQRIATIAFLSDTMPGA